MLESMHHHWIDRLAIAAGILSGVALYPQIYIILTSPGIVGVSATTYAVILGNNIVWLAYSLHRRLLSLGIASVLNILGSGAVVVWFFTA